LVKKSNVKTMSKSDKADMEQLLQNELSK